MAATGDSIVFRINIPSLKLQKAIRVSTNDCIWMVKKQLEEKVGTEIKDVLNYGLFLHGKDGKRNKFLDERNTIASYHLDATVLIFDVVPARFRDEVSNWCGIGPKETKEDI
jgi:hypothetical protein